MIRHTVGVAVVFSVVAGAFVACGGTTATVGQNPAPSDPAPAATVTNPTTPKKPDPEAPKPPTMVVSDAGPDVVIPAPVHKPGPLSFGMCAAVDACDASPVGTWEFKSGCIDDLLAPARERCDGIRVDTNKGTVAGTVTFTDKDVERSLDYLADATFFVPSSCTQGFSCRLIGPAIPMSVPGATGKCFDAPGDDGCDCSVHVDYKESTGKVAYTRDGGHVTASTGETFDMCASDAALRMKTVAGETSRVPGGTLEFTKL